ncbi:MAG TPA: Gfo/Idh/MocA family oxidoreductase [Candidatus Brocadiia bacterium]|nr:Gfo/Idh/MocA family oxidoreductase [Candidatus Brocadiia bacterium]
MLKVGIIGYGSRVSGMAKSLSIFGIPFKIAAVCDPRKDEIKAKDDGFLKDARFYDTPEALLDTEELDGVMIGTRCNLHTPMAIKVARRGLPLFLEKPVAISFDQVKALDEAFRDYPAPVVVSFPLRTSPIAERVKQIIDSGEIGSVEHVVGFNDVPYGWVYYRRWYRDYETMQGLFLQKATHDFDCVNFLVGQRPKWVCAMTSRRVYGPGRAFGSGRPFDLACAKCAENMECPEGPFRRFHDRFEGDKVVMEEKDMCLFAEGVRNEDSGNAIIEFENGAQYSYSQNFFARGQAARRGARLYGYKGTIHFDWYENKIHVYPHQRPGVTTIDFSAGGMSHFGGDRELAYDFLMAMKERRPTRTPIAAGVLSALTCLCARQSAETRRFVEVKMPG